MRVIGGVLRGKRLVSVPGNRTRPTSDRLRETVFNVLGSRVKETFVLDLFAGTGALGIEALSRGAAQAVFLDHRLEAVEVIRRNVASCRLESRARIYRWDVLRNLNILKASPEPFSLVFMDPPYERGMVAPTFLNLSRCGCLQDRCDIVAEHASGEPVSNPPAGYELLDRREFGKTLVSIFRFMVELS